MPIFLKSLKIFFFLSSISDMSNLLIFDSEKKPLQLALQVKITILLIVKIILTTYLPLELI